MKIYHLFKIIHSYEFLSVQFFSLSPMKKKSYAAQYPGRNPCSMMNFATWKRWNFWRLRSPLDRRVYAKLCCRIVRISSTVLDKRKRLSKFWGWSIKLKIFFHDIPCVCWKSKEQFFSNNNRYINQELIRKKILKKELQGKRYKKFELRIFTSNKSIFPTLLKFHGEQNCFHELFSLISALVKKIESIFF